MEVLHSLHGHLLSGEQWMKMIDEILINDPGFSATTHDQCIHKRTDSCQTVSILRQVDDFLAGTSDKSIAERIAGKIGKQVKFHHEENPPNTFLGLVEDCNGVDVKLMSAKGHIERMPKTHGWGKESPDCPKPCRDDETKGNLVSPMPADCITWIQGKEGFKEGTVEHSVLENKMGFQCRVVPGEPMCAMVTA